LRTRKRSDKTQERTGVTRISIDSAVALEPQLAEAVTAIRRGGVVAFPTDTLYGLAADPRQPDALRRLMDLKGRAAEKTVALIAGSLEQAREVAMLDENALRLAALYWPGPLTLVVPARPHVAEPVRSPSGHVGVRVPAHAVARALALAAGTPLTATSANSSGSPATADPDEVARLLPNLEVLVDAGILAGGPPSTLVQLDHGVARVLREGAIATARVLESLVRIE
jgi:L-threonylcarbamoyladenylate synthase